MTIDIYMQELPHGYILVWDNQGVGMCKSELAEMHPLFPP